MAKGQLLKFLFGRTLSSEIESEKGLAKLRFFALISVVILNFSYAHINRGPFLSVEFIFIIVWLFGYNLINFILLSNDIYHPFIKFITAAGDIICATLLIRITGDIHSPILIGYAISIFVYGVRYQFLFSFYCTVLITFCYIGLVVSDASGFSLYSSHNIFFEFVRMLYLWIASLVTQSDAAEQFNSGTIVDELLKIIFWWIAALLAGIIGKALNQEHQEIQEAHSSLHAKVEEAKKLQKQKDEKQVELDKSLIDLKIQKKQLEIERDRSVNLTSEMKLIRQHSQTVNNTFNIDEIYEDTVRVMAEIISTSYADLYRFDTDGKYGYHKLSQNIGYGQFHRQ